MPSTTFTRFLELPSELQPLVAEQTSLGTSVLLIRSCQRLYRLLAASTFLPRQAAKHTLFPPSAECHWRRSPLHKVAAQHNVRLLAPILAPILACCTRIASPAEISEAVDRTDRFGLTPLLSALAVTFRNRDADRTRAEAVKLLLRHGAAPEPDFFAKPRFPKGNLYLHHQFSTRFKWEIMW